MLVARSVPLNNCCESEEEKTLDRMDDKDGVVKIKDVEEGEISDSASVEEISEEDFKKQEVDKVVVLKESPKIDTRVWTMQDLFSKYPMSRGYATGLYNFAWAQAVQNKPLNEVYAMDVDSDESSKRSLSTAASSSVKEESKVINVDSGDEMDVKMEECVKVEEELEEGEIDLDSEPAEAEAGGEGSSDDSVIESELEKKVNSIREALESVSVVEAEKSFEGVCSRLHNTLESVQAVLKNIVPTKEALIQLSFCAIQAVNSVFCSFNHNQKEQNKEVFTRLINLVINQDPPIFSSERIKEVEAMVPAPNSTSALSSGEVNDKNKEKPVIDVANQHDPATSAEDAGQKLNSSRKFESYLNKSDVKMLSEASKPGQSSFRGRGGLAPLLDLHKDHDSDSLPSPTRENPPFVFAPRSLAVGEGMPKQEFVTASRPESATTKVAHGVGGPVMHPYETEAVKAVSSYQQKFGRTSFFSNDTLPSPTPSEESDKGEGDISGEVSSSYTVANVKNVDPPIVTRPPSSPAPHMNSSSVQGLTSAISSGHASSVSNPSIKAPSKSRDPRLRFASSSSSAMDFNQNPLPVVSNAPKVEPSEAISRPRRSKSVPDPILDGPALKRQRNGPTNTDLDRDVKIAAGSGGWLEDTGTVGPKFMTKNHLIESTRNDPRKMDTQVTWPTTDSVKPTAVTCGIEQVPIACTSTTSTTPALPDILKDLAVNPTMLLNLLKMGQQQMLAAEAQQKSANNPITTMHPPSSISISGAVPLANVASLKPLILEQKPAETVQVPSEAGPKNLQDDVGKIRMKPRDPRRFLHSNSVQKSGNLISEQFKTNGPPNSVQKSGNLMSEQFKTNAPPALITQGSMDNVTPQNLEDQADTSSMTSQPVAIPDIARQFTKSLKNIADLVSSSQSVPPSVASPSLPVQTNMDKIDTKAVNSESEEQQSGTGPVTGEGVTGPLGSQNTWGDVQHLFEGYDDQQKAAIQKERTRRLEEQEKMFAARKLCLVLDLDHTLLNSAKFIEVDPMHDEILRKKEEQDREKPQRHLYRFPHMGMWTKLRPGIWNFLEKASKLFEMHLYTMGNKLYATEMAKILDPKGNLFAGRVISRGDDGDPTDGDERVPKSKDLEGVLGMESGVVIIDDSIRVWPRNKLNLIVVERYTYFPCSRRQFGLAGPSLLEIDHDERLDDGTLASCSAVIERIHQSFFSHRSLLDADVRNILASEQQKILAGCRIVFSRVFPVGDATPHLHPLWQTAKQFGAVCTNQIDEHVTHVVANSLGTDKVNWALSTGRFVVHPGWVEASALLYRRANEQDFAIKP